MSVAILSYMLLVLLAAFMWARPPYMPLRPPNTMAAYMYYVCDSAMLSDFGEGIDMMGQRERDRLVGEMGKTYMYGELVGTVSGVRRIGVDYGVAPT